MPRDIARLSIVCSILLASGAVLVVAGPLDPPGGPIVGTGKTTQEVFDKVGAAEPRVPINAVNTPGDADSMFAINQSGSYYLTADITAFSGKSGIKINNGGAPNVTIDLNGFTIRGSGGSLDGIRTTLIAGGTTLRIFNGAITQMGGMGTNINAQNLDLTHLAVQFSGTDGISYSGDAVTISGCRSFWNGGDGFHSSSSANISGCAATFNTGDGFDVGGGRISACTVTSSTGRAIAMGNLGQVIDCVVASSQDGITVGAGCMVARNKVTVPNTRIGIHSTGNSNRIEENDIQGGLTGVQVDANTGNVVVKNSARAAVTPYTVPAANFFGPLVNTAAGVAAASPWANFAY